MPRKLALLALLLTAAAPSGDPVVAERGNDKITVSQLRAMVEQTDADTRVKLQTSPQAMNGLIRDIFLQRAILAAAAQAKWSDRPDVATMLKRVRDTAIAQSFLTAQAPVPPDYPSATELQDAYEKAKPQLLQPRAYHLAQAFLEFGGGTTEEAARAKLVTLQKEVSGGHATWDDAAKHVGAKTQDLGWLPESNLKQSARDAVSGLLEGQLSAPICSATNCSVLKLLATRPAGPAPLAEVRENLIRAMRQAKQRAEEQAYADKLLNKEPVRINEIELPHVTAP